MTETEFIAALPLTTKLFVWGIYGRSIGCFHKDTEPETRNVSSANMHCPITALATVICNRSYRFAQTMHAAEHLGLELGSGKLAHRISLAAAGCGDEELRGKMLNALKLKNV